MKRGGKKELRRYGRFSVRILPCVMYGLLFVFLLFLSQLVLHPITAVFVLFFLTLPLVDVALLFACSHFLWVEFEEGKHVFTRKSAHAETFSLPLRVVNRGILPIPRIRLLLYVPVAYSPDANLTAVSVMLPPFSAGTVEMASALDSRGVYTVGVQELYVGDYLHLFRLRQDIGRYAQIKILPREISPYGLLTALEGSSHVRNQAENNQVDNGDVREYRAGDAIKSIHWKLSSKTEELQVKERSSNTGRRVVIVCDLAETLGEEYGFSPHTAIKSDDGVAEEALAAAKEAILQGATGTLIMANGLEIHSVPFQGLADLSVLADFLAQARGRVNREAFLHFMEIMPSPEDTTVLYVTAFLSSDCEEVLKDAARCSVGVAFRVCVCRRTEWVSEDKKVFYEAQLSELCRKLTAAGIRVTVPKRKGEDK
ncbi:MAG: DUF58 domain-containing protein [Clostridia bacterium]|nr:DUF58 domain-containing protein [Clostridia bacterium]